MYDDVTLCDTCGAGCARGGGGAPMQGGASHTGYGHTARLVWLGQPLHGHASGRPRPTEVQ